LNPPAKTNKSNSLNLQLFGIISQSYPPKINLTVKTRGKDSEDFQVKEEYESVLQKLQLAPKNYLIIIILQI